jgi:uncharacterized protein (TIGR02996 family)
MAATVTEREALWRAVVANPADAAPKLILADWLQERGAEADLERGLRWCAANGKWPARFGVFDKDQWEFFWSPKPDRRHTLPRDVWRAIYLPGHFALMPGERIIRKLGAAVTEPVGA